MFASDVRLAATHRIDALRSDAADRARSAVTALDQAARLIDATVDPLVDRAVSTLPAPVRFPATAFVAGSRHLRSTARRRAQEATLALIDATAPEVRAAASTQTTASVKTAAPHADEQAAPAPAKATRGTAAGKSRAARGAGAANPAIKASARVKGGSATKRTAPAKRTTGRTGRTGRAA